MKIAVMSCIHGNYEALDAVLLDSDRQKAEKIFCLGNLVGYGPETVKLLWESVSCETVQWLRTLDFGFFELDCLLIHATTVAVDEELTPETHPIIMCVGVARRRHRLSRMQANNLFCGRSGLAFQYQLQAGSITTSITTLDSQAFPQTMKISPRQIIGVGNVGRIPTEAKYTLYTPGTNHLEFRTVRYGVSKGFQVKSTESSFLLGKKEKG